ncbi:PilN domain-containing protein [Geminicoccus flavidas]|uniref:PilN domain-containing protein n=1 Tax=Geminicoccus flavidas TaxID=2506407 RepID=UPI00135A57ED|nr:PilN domain-containing protein [Geminicoccus flavidas]
MSAATLDEADTGNGFQRFWQWWTGELGSFLPRRRRDPLLRKAVILLYDGVGFRVMVRRGTDDAVDLGRLDLPRPSRIDVKRGVAEPRLVPDEQSVELAERIRRSRMPVVLRLPASEGLVTRDELPAAAERHLQDVLAHRVDVLTPWTPEQIAYDARVIDRPAETGKIRIEATFAPREVIDRLLGTLAGFELQPAVIDVAGVHVDELPRVDLLQGKGRRGSRLGLMAFIGVAALVPLVTLVLAYDIWQRSALVEERRAQEQRLVERRQEADLAQAERLQALADANFLNARRAERPSSLVALEIISRALPDDAWLSRFELAGNQITLTGEASEAPRVLALIGADPRFGNAALGNSSTRGPSVAPELFGLQVDRFTLTAQLAADAQVRPLGEDGLEMGPGGAELPRVTAPGAGPEAAVDMDDPPDPAEPVDPAQGGVP